MGGLCEVGLSVEVVPPPYPVNFRCTSAITYFDGILHYQYSWESSTGKLADLAVSKCTIKERISYEGNSSGQDFYDENGNLVAYLYPLPFDEFHVNPEIGEVVPGADGVLGDDHNIPVISEPYQYASFLTTQNYIYTDDTMDPNNPNDFITLRGPLEIVRTIWAPDINWVYDVIKYDSPEGLSGYLEASKILGPVYPQFGP